MGSGVLGGHLELSGLLSRIMEAVVGWRTEKYIYFIILHELV